MKNPSQKSDRAARYIDLETISEYVFTELNLNPEDVLEIDLNLGRYDTKQILLKPHVDTDKLINDFPDTYKGFAVSVSKLTQTTTKVTFKNVPSELTDEEILNLCKF